MSDKEKVKRCPKCKNKVKLLWWDNTWWWDEHYDKGSLCSKSHLRK